MANFDCSIVFVPHPTDPRFINQTGKAFGQLTVIRYLGKQLWECRCKCGLVKSVSSSNLRRTKSCGCLNKEVSGSRWKTHGLRHTTEYTSYALAKARCTNKNHPAYSRYGARGIEFRIGSFVVFLEHLGLKPDAKHSLDRIDVNGHYEIGNIRWASVHEQNTNTRRTIYATINGVTKSLVDWTGFQTKAYHHARNLVRKNGVSAEDAVSVALIRWPTTQ